MFQKLQKEELDLLGQGVGGETVSNLKYILCISPQPLSSKQMDKRDGNQKTNWGNFSQGSRGERKEGNQRLLRIYHMLESVLATLYSNGI